MTTPAQHRQQAAENLRLHEELFREKKHLDWALTLLFYAALHYIDAYLLPIDPPDHSQRNGLIRDSPEVRSVWRSYRLLFERSLDARYECFDPTPDQLSRYRADHFDPIQTRLLDLLGA